MIEKNIFSGFWRKTGTAFVAGCALIAGSVAISAPAKKTNWLQSFTQSSIGGMIIGNPNARVKIIEYGSYTCPKCAQFEKQDMPLLKQQFIANGKVSFEFRNFARDGIDLSVAVLARCGGPTRFFGNHKLLLSTQDTWINKANSLSATTNAALAAKDAAGFMQGVYKDLGLGPIMAQTGLTKAQMQACMSDPKAFNFVQEMTADGARNRNLHGTPHFLINDKHEHSVHDMASLRPYLPYD